MSKKSLYKGVVGAYVAVENGVVKCYKSIEKGVVTSYKAVESATVDSYKSVEDSACRMGRCLAEEYHRRKREQSKDEDDK